MSSHLHNLFAAEFDSLPATTQQDVYQEFYHLVYPMVRFIMKDHGATEDIIQEAFLRAIRKASQLQEQEKVASWLKTLTRNVAFNYLRKWRKSRGELDSDEVFESIEAALSVHEMPIEQEVETKMMEEAITRYIHQLKPEYRQILEMRLVHHLSYKEMAATLNVKEGMIRHKLHRAREEIKNKLQKEWNIT
ncbi:MAG: RNA polymerase sigma factor [Paenibacillaceae bacterium]|uniref:RNA polymerase sigma factor n=1 Tax=Paenibacillus cymbidii TaxID=1639034 RepID=UPI001080B9BC|nr:RNA polymerase sigma factor [Paenibacillus cymbidii]MBO9607605.1 RNA polymerase sigma factor [Paenibacillaceae bacterium]